MRVVFVYLNGNKYVNRGAGYVASSILDAGHQLYFFDTAYHSLETISSEIVAGDYDVLMISASSLFREQVIKLTAMVKLVSSVPILLGGLYPTIVRVDAFGECPHIDYICVGEGEAFVLEFLDALNGKGDIRAIANLGYRSDDGSVIVNPVRAVTDLDNLPPFRFNLFPPEAIVQPQPRPGFCYVYATRGCPYNCSFCCNSFYSKLYGCSYLRTRGVDATIAELLQLKERYPVKLFYFGDEMILFDEVYVTELFHRVQAEVKLPFGCMARVERITPSIVRLFDTTGCKYVGIGIECGDEQFRRDFLNRHMTNEQIVQAFGALRTINGMFLTSFNMRHYPVPYDNRLTRTTQRLNKTVRPDITQWSTFYPFRGTRLYDYCIEHDLIDFDKVRQVEDVFTMSVLKPWKKSLP